MHSDCSIGIGYKLGNMNCWLNARNVSLVELVFLNESLVNESFMHPAETDSSNRPREWAVNWLYLLNEHVPFESKRIIYDKMIERSGDIIPCCLSFFILNVFKLSVY